MSLFKSNTKNKASQSTSLSNRDFLRSFGKPSRILIAILAFANVGVAVMLYASAAPGLMSNYEPSHAAQVNGWRAANGVAGLSRSSCMTNAARAWSVNMASSLTMKHSGTDGPTIRAYYGKYCPNAGSAPYMGENVAMFYTSSPVSGEQLAAQIFNQFKNSPHHNANMLNGTFRYVGYGAAHVQVGSLHYYYATQSFVNCGSVCSSAWTSSPAEIAVASPSFTGISVAKKTDTGGTGYWTVKTNGSVQAYGAAKHYGDLVGKSISGSVVDIESPSTGGGYWIVTSSGAIYSFGAAGYYGGANSTKLNSPIVGMAPAPSGNGYWLLGGDGGIFSYGSARFWGSTGGMTLNKPVVGMSAFPTGGGYWLVASDGGIFSFGTAKFYGSTGSMKLNAPVIGMISNASGSGYWLFAADGGIFSFGSIGFYGSAAGKLASGEVVTDVSPFAGSNGYYMTTNKNRIFKCSGSCVAI